MRRLRRCGTCVCASSFYLITSQPTTQAEAALVLPRLRRQRGAPPPISEEMGISRLPIFNNEFFDPLELADDDNFAVYREAELKHGRVAMLATLGMTLPDFFRNQLIPDDLYLSKSLELRFQDVPCGLQALGAVPREGWLQILLAVGFVDVFVLVQQGVDEMPGDYGVGYFGLVDKARHENELEAEIEIGRLAMLAFVIQVVEELVTGQTVAEFWSSLAPYAAN
mmetsp:Transcript_10329/g.17079  ORF Transcript_10329/g.17079 Transcript_10329/m.17079 type:complete len:224 (-) Transcript_10329:139-810(-)